MRANRHINTTALHTRCRRTHRVRGFGWERRELLLDKLGELAVVDGTDGAHQHAVDRIMSSDGMLERGREQ